jgi:hypothetical protein
MMNASYPKTTAFKGLAGLVFAAMLVMTTLLNPLTASARNEPGAPGLVEAARPGMLQTPSAPGRPSSVSGETFLFLPIVFGAVGGPVITPTPVITPPPGSEGALFMSTTKKTDSASAAVDAAGGFHLAYVAYVPFVEGAPAYYAYCTASCETSENWSRVSLSDRVEEVQLALTSTGHPRLLIRGKTTNYDDRYQYAACDGACTNAANWTILDVTTSTYSPVYVSSYSGHRYFALDHLDRPRFLYRKTISDASYAYCDIDCTSTVTDNWWEYPLNSVMFSDPTNYPTLTFTSTNQPRITAVIMGDPGTPGSKDYLTYIACDTDCINQANWSYTTLMERGSGNVSSVLRFTSTGQPRLVFNQGIISGTAGYLYYLWCNNGCTNNANWSGSSVGAQGQAEDPDLALNDLDQPRIAFKQSSPDGLGYAWCNTSCESVSAAWSGELKETGSDLDIEWPIPPPTSCSSSYWYDGYRPSLALDSTGNPRIGYVGQHLYGGSGCSVKEDFRAVRFMFFSQP